MRCLEHDFYHEILSFLKPDIQRFVSEAKYIRSVTGFLERISTLASRVVDISKELNLNPVDIFKLILSCEEVKEVLKILASYSQYIKEQIMSDPRYKILRPFADLLVETLLTLPLSEEILVISRPSLQQLESQIFEEKRRSIIHAELPVLSKREFLKPRYKKRSEKVIESIERPRKRFRFRESISTILSPRVRILCFYIIPLILASMNYIFAPWIVIYKVIETPSEEIKNYTIIYSGWNVTYFQQSFLFKSDEFNILIWLWIWLYAIGLILAIFALMLRNPLVSFGAGLAMCIGIYDFQNRVIPRLELIHQFFPGLAHQISPSNLDLLQAFFSKIIEFKMDVTIHVMLAGIFGAYILIIGTIILYFSD